MTRHFDYHRAPDKSFNVGRCNRCDRRPVYCWTAGTLSAGNDTVRCPVCAHPLDRTSRMATSAFRILDDAYIVGQMWENASRMRATQFEYATSAGHARSNDADDYRASLWQDRADKAGAEADKLTAKAGKMAARAVCDFIEAAARA